jgi:CheY-like chemotaxis protein
MKRDRVLVIDDDEYFRELVALMLHDAGLECLDAADCPSALGVLEGERHRVRAVLVDYFMPGFDPPRCAEELRARLDPGVPLVLVSAAVDIAERAAEMKVRWFLAKPFEMEELRAMVLMGPGEG